MNHGLSDDTTEGIYTVLSRHPQVEKAVLYGSRAKGTHRNGSDIDLVLLGDGLGFDDLLEIGDELDDLLLPYTIDLSLFSMITHANLRGHIRRVGREFYHRSVSADAGH